MTTSFVAAPNPINYRVGRGKIFLGTVSNQGTTDLGNCTKFELKSTPTSLKHFSTAVGTQIMDAVAITRLDAEVDFELDEINGTNVSMWALDNVPGGLGATNISLFNVPKLEVSLYYTDTSSFGPTVNVFLPKVLIEPTAVMSLISSGSGDWTKLNIKASVEYDPVTALFAQFQMTGA